MRVHGVRRDGVLFVSLGGGVGVLLRHGRDGHQATPPTDLSTLHAMGPWELQPQPSPLKLARELDRAQTVPVQAFSLGKD